MSAIPDIDSAENDPADAGRLLVGIAADVEARNNKLSKLVCLLLKAVRR